MEAAQTSGNLQIGALSQTWLDATACNQNLDVNGCNSQTSGGAGGTVANGYYGGGTGYIGQPYWYPVYCSSPSRPIKLALSEVERLRKAAKADPKLKEILSKFTSQIEVVVDFE